MIQQTIANETRNQSHGICPDLAEYPLYCFDTRLAAHKIGEASSRTTFSLLLQALHSLIAGLQQGITAHQSMHKEGIQSLYTSVNNSLCSTV